MIDLYVRYSQFSESQVEPDLSYDVTHKSLSTCASSDIVQVLILSLDGQTSGLESGPWMILYSVRAWVWSVMAIAS